MKNKGMHLPEHKNPKDHRRIASAPFNFVPLPETIILAAPGVDDLPDHNHYYANTSKYKNTGFFDVELTTLSPLYIRGPIAETQFNNDERGLYADGKPIPEKGSPEFRRLVKNLPDFFYTRNLSNPVIPGSSLRGMIRSLLEIVSYSKIKWVNEKNLFFRTLDNYYTDRMLGKVRTGFLVEEKGAYFIKVCEMVRVPRNKLEGKLYQGKGPNKTPIWRGKPHQHIPVWVKLSQDRRFVKEIEFDKKDAYEEGILVITGDIPRKKKEFVFLLPKTVGKKIEIQKSVIDLFHDDDQITGWQQMAFPKDKPENNCRKRNGMLLREDYLKGEREPIFFLQEDGDVTFMGRAYMFRLPYENKVADLVPNHLNDPQKIDYSEAIFGFIRTEMKQNGRIKGKQGEKSHAFAGRVFVTDAVPVAGQKNICYHEPIEPSILASPKPTAFQFYLTQQEPDRDNRLDHYGSPPPHKTTIRGFKRYWHQGNRAIEDIEAQKGDPDVDEHGRVIPHSKQYTQVKPVKPEIKFKFRLYFENLSDQELGALCWILHPLGDKKKEYVHKLGMGKPLGMGAVKLDATLFLTDRQKRYNSLFSNDGWESGIGGGGEKLSSSDVLKERIKPFERDILDKLGLEQCQHLYELKRVAMLLKLMEWPGFPQVREGEMFLKEENRPNTRYMHLEEFRQRRVLPDPSAFGELTGKIVPDPHNKISKNNSADNSTVINNKVEEHIWEDDSLTPIQREMEEDGYSDDPNQFMESLTVKWLDRMDAEDALHAEQQEIACRLANWYKENRLEQWEKPTGKNIKKVQRIQKVLDLDA